MENEYLWQCHDVYAFYLSIVLVIQVTYSYDLAYFAMYNKVGGGVRELWKIIFEVSSTWKPFKLKEKITVNEILLEDFEMNVNNNLCKFRRFCLILSIR